MADEVVMALISKPGIRAVVVSAAEVARTAREKHQAMGASSLVLAEGFVAASLLSALQLQKSSAKINLQLECDGPLRGIFVESDGSGVLRGYPKNPFVQYQGQQGEYHWRPVYGNSGFLSVLRDQGNGEYFRSAVELEAFDLPRDFERYFAVSEQVETRLAMTLQKRGDERLGAAVGVLLQALPDGDVKLLNGLADRIRDGALESAVSAQQGDVSPGAVLSELLAGQEFEVTARYPLKFACPCSKDRVIRALVTLGKDELTDMVEREGQADATCQFCATKYVVNADELRQLIAQLSA